MGPFSDLGNADCPFISIITAFPELIPDKQTRSLNAFFHISS